MTCKDCLNEVCGAYRCIHLMDKENAEKECPSFKNKADYVEVIRCVECGFRDDNFITTSQNIDCYMCKRHHSLVLLTDFCSYGKRKQKNDFKEEIL